MKILIDRGCWVNTTERKFVCDVKEKLRRIAHDPSDLARAFTGFWTTPQNARLCAFHDEFVRYFAQF